MTVAIDKSRKEIFDRPFHTCFEFHTISAQLPAHNYVFCARNLVSLRIVQ